MTAIIQQIHSYGVIPVVTVTREADALPLAAALRAGGLPIAEITFRSACAAAAISLIAQSDPDMLVGAGTVLDAKQAEAAIAAGAAFVVSPGYSAEVVAYCQKRGVPVIPGCSNATDITAAANAGLEAVKFFPAEAAGGIAALKALSAPFVGMKFVPTGGITLANLADYLALPSVVACGGTFIATKELLDRGDFAAITANARAAVTEALGLSIAHVALYADSADKLGATAATLAAILGEGVHEFNPDVLRLRQFEVIRDPAADMPHIALYVNSCERAAAHLSRMGIELDDSTRAYNNNGDLRFVYFKEKIAGCRFHLLRR